MEGNLEVKAGSWSGGFRVWFHEGELNLFASDIEQLYADLVGPAEFHPLEPYIELRLAGNGKGQVVMDGKAQDIRSNGTFLVFRLEMDQTELPGIATSLKLADPI